MSKRISELGSGGAAAPGDEIEVLRSGVNYRIPVPTGGSFPGFNQYRLSLTSGDPEELSEVTASSNLIWTPDLGEHALLPDGSSWNDYSGGEITKSLTGLLTTGKIYDALIDWNGGSPQLAISQWTDDTNRATALTRLNGVRVLNGALDHLYVGSFMAISANETCDFGGTASQAGGKRFLYNHYNQIWKYLKVFDTTNTWNYSTATWRAAGGVSTNMVEFLVGVLRDAYKGTIKGYGNGTAGNVNGSVAVGWNSTTVASGLPGTTGGNGATISCTSEFDLLPRLGYNFATWLETGNGNATMTWYGDVGSTGNQIQSGLTMRVRV